MTEDKTEGRTLEFVCDGLAFLKKRAAPCPRFRQLTPDGRIEPGIDPRFWPYPNIHPGLVYTIEVDGHDRAGRPKFRRQWGDEDQRAQWELEAKSVRAVAAAEAAERKAGRDDALLACLRPARMAWLNAAPRNRRAIELVVLDYLRRGDDGRYGT